MARLVWPRGQGSVACYSPRTLCGYRDKGQQHSGGGISAQRRSQNPALNNDVPHSRVSGRHMRHLFEFPALALRGDSGAREEPP